MSINKPRCVCTSSAGPFLHHFSVIQGRRPHEVFLGGKGVMSRSLAKQSLDPAPLRGTLWTGPSQVCEGAGFQTHLGFFPGAHILPSLGDVLPEPLCPQPSARSPVWWPLRWSSHSGGVPCCSCSWWKPLVCLSPGHWPLPRRHPRHCPRSGSAHCRRAATAWRLLEIWDIEEE